MQVNYLDITPNDQYIDVNFYMSKNGSFMYINDKNEIIKKYSSHLEDKNFIKLINEYKQSKEKVNINNLKMNLHLYIRKREGIAHSICILCEYIEFISNQRKSNLLIPDFINQNIKNITNNIFSNKIKYLQHSKIYHIKNFFISRYFEIMTDKNIIKSRTRLPLLMYNNSIYYFRAKINRYIDFDFKTKLKPYPKIFVGKFEGQGLYNTSNIQPPRSLLGCVPKSILERFENNGFITIDPYKYHIHEVIYFIRHCKELILSCGTCGHLYSPYIPQNVKVNYLTNSNWEHGFNLDEKNLIVDYNPNSSIVLRFINNINVCYYKYAPHYDKGITEKSAYKGKDMFDSFLK